MPHRDHRNGPPAVLNHGMESAGNKSCEQESKQRCNKPPKQQRRTQNKESGWGEDAIHADYPDSSVAFRGDRRRNHPRQVRLKFDRTEDFSRRGQVTVFPNGHRITLPPTERNLGTAAVNSV